jgi:hypothetical protein
MTNNFMQWGAILVELIGLLLVAIELYFPKISESLKAFFEETKPKIIKNSLIWIGSYIFIWVITTIGLSIWDQSMNLMANVFFTIITIIILLIIGISKTLVRLGVVLGRGNSVGGVGLVLALIGFSIEVIQLL